jgi:hypothetical protein
LNEPKNDSLTHTELVEARRAYQDTRSAQTELIIPAGVPDEPATIFITEKVALQKDRAQFFAESEENALNLRKKGIQNLNQALVVVSSAIAGISDHKEAVGMYLKTLQTDEDRYLVTKQFGDRILFVSESSDLENIQIIIREPGLADFFSNQLMLVSAEEEGMTLAKADPSRGEISLEFRVARGATGVHGIPAASSNVMWTQGKTAIKIPGLYEITIGIYRYLPLANPKDLFKFVKQEEVQEETVGSAA